MLSYILLSTVLVHGTIIFNSLLLIGATRPKYRLDYRYEKAFDNFYKLHSSAVTWEAARIRCQAEGSELLVLDTLDEADAMPLLSTLILNKFEGVFVGIHDLFSERSFVTIRGTTLMDSILNLLWEYKEPQQGHGRCVAMRRTGRIFVHSCDKPLPFICKTKANNIEFNTECNSFDKKWQLGPNETCYFMHEEPQTWSQAFASCLSAGGHLAILNNQSEADHLKAIFKMHEPKRMPLDNFAFMGFSDIFKRHHYRTVEGERIEDAGYKEWEVNCPGSGKQEDYNTATAQRCGGMRRNGLLATSDCNLPAMFFCEKPANTSIIHNILRLAPENQKQYRQHLLPFR